MTHKLLESEGHNGILNRTIMPTINNSNEYKTKTKTDIKQKIRQNYLTSSSFPQLPVKVIVDHCIQLIVISRIIINHRLKM